MIITISGTPGSGKSTIGKKLARSLGYRHLDAGQLWRAAARRRGMSLAELQRLAESDRTVDTAIDARQRALGRIEDNLVIEGRLSFLFIPHSLKIFLFVTLRNGARRIWNELQNATRRNDALQLRSVSDVERAIRRRMRSDRLRYRKLYRTDPFQKKHYDLFLDTTRLTPEAVYKRVRAYVVEKEGRAGEKAASAKFPKHLRR